MAQAVEVHVGAAVDRNQRLPFAALAFDIGLQAGQCQRTGRLGDAAGVVVNIFEGAADVVGVHQNNVVQQILADGKSFLAHQLHRRAVGKQADIFQFYPLAFVDRLLHRAGIKGFHANHFDFRAHVFDKRRHARRQTAAANGNKNRINRLGMLADDFQPDGALAGDYIRIVKRRNIS